MPDNVFTYDNGIVDQQADGQGERHQGHDVEGHAHGVHDDESRDNRNRQSHAGDDRGTPGVDEAEHDQHGQHTADDQGLLNVFQGFAGHDRAVPDQGEGRLDHDP